MGFRDHAISKAMIESTPLGQRPGFFASGSTTEEARALPLRGDLDTARAPQNLHRNNAAEWVMWIAILPVVALARLFSRKATQ